MIVVLLSFFSLAFLFLSSPPFSDFCAPYRLIVHLFGNLGCVPSLLFGTPQPVPQVTFLATVRDVTLDLLKCSHLLQTLQCTEEVIFINDRMDLAWMALCLLFNKKGGPTLYFICHRCFSFLQQCSIVSTKISGSMNRRILYYYVPAKFQSLFSFSCSQRAHNLLSTMRQATKLHCCSANRLVLVDGSTCCEVCLSAAAAATEGSLGTPSPSRPREKEK